MISKCYDCPRTKQFIKLDGSPCCGATDFYLNVITHIAECPICKMQWGVPMALVGLCENDRRYRKYSITVPNELNKKQIIEFAKLIGMNGVQVYHLFKGKTSVAFDNIPMVLAYKIHKYFRIENISIHVTPSLNEYHLFEKCEKI